MPPPGDCFAVASKEIKKLRSHFESDKKTSKSLLKESKSFAVASKKSAVPSKGIERVSFTSKGIEKLQNPHKGSKSFITSTGLEKLMTINW